MSSMKGKIAVVTGGTRGMGADISLALAEKDITVVAVYHSDKSSAAKTEKDLKAVSPESCIMQCDVSDKKDVDKLIAAIGNRYGRIDILVNNAGVFDFKFLEDMDEAFLDRMFRVNFKSQIFITQACLPYLKKSGTGRVINASSISGVMADVGLIAYGASKASVDMFTRICAAELAPYGITVNAYAPGIVHTDMTDAMIQERGDIQVKQIPAGRFGTGREVAALIEFLCRDEAGYINGEIIGVDGGMLKVQNPHRAYEYKEEKEG